MDLDRNELWQRVLQPQQTDIPREQLEAWLAESRGAERSYLAMSRRGGGLAPMLRTMAAREREQTRRLQALRWLLYGCRDHVASAAAEGERSLAAALRSRYRGEKTAAREFRAAAKTYPEQKTLLDSMADTAETHCRLLQRAAEGLLQSSSGR